MDAIKRCNVKVAGGYVGGTGRARGEQQEQQQEQRVNGRRANLGQEASDRSEHWLGIATVAVAFRPAHQLPERELR